jgi:hypothetical protein
VDTQGEIPKIPTWYTELGPSGGAAFPADDCELGEWRVQVRAYEREASCRRPGRAYGREPGVGGGSGSAKP